MEGIKVLAHQIRLAKCELCERRSSVANLSSVTLSEHPFLALSAFFVSSFRAQFTGR